MKGWWNVFVRWHERHKAGVDSFVTLLTVAGLVVAIYQTIQAGQELEESSEQWRQSVEQWDREGADFKLRPVGFQMSLDTKTITSHGAISLLLSNDGRTEGTVISIKEKGEKAHRTVTCIPEEGKEGRLAINRGTTGNGIIGGREIELQPGQTQLLFIVKKEDKAPANLMGGNATVTMEYPDTYEVTLASGEKQTVRISDIDKEAISYYTALPGYHQTLSECDELANG